MKYDEKQRRKKLKRKIWAMAVILFVLLGITVWTWDWGWHCLYRYPTGPTGSYNSNSLNIQLFGGGILIHYAKIYDVTIKEDYYEINSKWLSTKDIFIIRYPNGWELGSGKIKSGNPPKSGYPSLPEAGYLFKFCGFQFWKYHAHRTGFVLCTVDEWTLVFPTWFLGVAPATLLIWWVIKLRRGERKLSAFPVIMQEQQNQPVQER